MTIAVQVNGKRRAEFVVAKTTDKDAIVAKAKEAVANHLAGKEIIKEIYVPNKLVNIVINDCFITNREQRLGSFLCQWA